MTTPNTNDIGAPLHKLFRLAVFADSFGYYRLPSDFWNRSPGERATVGLDVLSYWRSDNTSTANEFLSDLKTMMRDAEMFLTGREVAGSAIEFVESYSQPIAAASPSIQYITTRQLAGDSQLLLPHLPRDLSCIIGVARSGMIPATTIATALHLPLLSLDQETGIIQECGHGWRGGEWASVSAGRALVVDDTVGYGRSMRMTRSILEKQFPDYLFAAVYVAPDTQVKPDFWVRDLQLPHILEWNLFNSIVAEHSAFDFDGVICQDIAPEDDDDGERYLQAIENAKPLHLPRRKPVLIITARLEKYRQPTLRWMERWGVQATYLTMPKWENPAERTTRAVVEFKAAAIREWKRDIQHDPLYFESDPLLAREIAIASGVKTVCPPTEAVYFP